MAVPASQSANSFRRAALLLANNEVAPGPVEGPGATVTFVKISSTFELDKDGRSSTTGVQVTTTDIS